VLRIYFTAEDLGRVRLLTKVDPMWEMVFTRLRLCERDKAPVFARWERKIRQRATIGALTTGIQVLRTLSPLGSYFPDFLTPVEAEWGLSAAVDTIRATSRGRLHAELARLARTSRLPAWAHRVGAGDLTELTSLCATLVAYHRLTVEPDADRIQASVDADRFDRVRAATEHGVDGLLRSLRPVAHWRSPVLEVAYPLDAELHLAGRGLRLVPSYFCRHRAVAFADPTLTPTLAFPISHDHDWVCGTASGALAGLLGSTRAAVLASVGIGTTTTELAQRLDISLSAVSRHTAVLRESGLITTHRDSTAVVHVTTRLGRGLLDMG
jgi:DNA-binding transcriptional ArsR family regulator